MADVDVVVLYDGNRITRITTNLTNKNPNLNSFSMKVGLTQILRGDIVIQVSDTNQAKIKESAVACCILIDGNPNSKSNGVTIMADPSLITEIKEAISIPIITKYRIGHFVKIQILKSIGCDYIDESDTLCVCNKDHFINKHNFKYPLFPEQVN